HSFEGASKTISTPSNPCRSRSRLSIERSDSSRSASIVLSGTIVVAMAYRDDGTVRAGRKEGSRLTRDRGDRGACALDGDGASLQTVERRRLRERLVARGDLADEEARLGEIDERIRAPHEG